jgi:hypothetical protein
MADTQDQLDRAGPSELDEATHAELRLLFDESTTELLFAKSMQWRIVAATVVVYALLVVVAAEFSYHTGFVKGLAFLSFLISPFAVSMLVIFQMWQHTEIEIRRRIGEHFSGLFRELSQIKSKTEANIHRYILLCIMIATIVLANAIAFSSISRLYE